MFSESNAVCLVQYTIPLPQNTQHGNRPKLFNPNLCYVPSDGSKGSHVLAVTAVPNQPT